MPGLPGKHGAKVPCKAWSDICPPEPTHTSQLSLTFRDGPDSVSTMILLTFSIIFFLLLKCKA